MMVNGNCDLIFFAGVLSGFFNLSLIQGAIMTKQAEHEENIKATEGGMPPSNKALFRMLVRMKLQLIANYILDGFAPVVAVAALIIAVMAINGNHSGLAQLEMNAASIGSLNSSLAASKAELEKLRTAMAQEKALREQTSKKQDEQMAKIVHNVSPMQTKMKISPTLAEQLYQPASAAAATTTVNNASAVPAAIPVAAATDKKSGSQGQVLTKAIEKFNGKIQK